MTETNKNLDFLPYSWNRGGIGTATFVPNPLSIKQCGDLLSILKRESKWSNSGFRLPPYSILI